MRQFTAKTADNGVRVDVFVARLLSEFSRSSLGRLFDSGSVRVNGKATKAGNKLSAGDRVVIFDKNLGKAPRSIKLPAIYEDNDVIVIDKPAGVLTHSKGTFNDEATVASSLAAKLDKRLTGNRAGIVHRLDRWTSGVMIIAKNPEALASLQRQFSSRKVKKVYRAVVEGIPAQKEAIIDAPIGRNPKKPQTFIVSAGGKPAQTRYKALKMGDLEGRAYSILELEPATGRTHQLRVHLAYIGHPIVGDDLYGKPGELMLHAKVLRLRLPSGDLQTFTSQVPERFIKFQLTDD